MFNISSSSQLVTRKVRENHEMFEVGFVTRPVFITLLNTALAFSTPGGWLMLPRFGKLPPCWHLFRRRPSVTTKRLKLAQMYSAYLRSCHSGMPNYINLIPLNMFKSHLPLNIKNGEISKSQSSAHQGPNPSLVQISQCRKYRKISHFTVLSRIFAVSRQISTMSRSFGFEQLHNRNPRIAIVNLKRTTVWTVCQYL